MVDGQTSDGYHTFDELYEHRISLYLLTALLLKQRGVPVWRSCFHHDGSSIQGWFILGVQREPGTQITYHLPLTQWDNASFAETIRRAPEWDKHTSVDVVARLNALRMSMCASNVPRPDEMAMPFYGPQQCDICGEPIIRASLEVGGRRFSPPLEGERYPNAWKEHSCRSLRFRQEALAIEKSTAPVQESDQGGENASK